MHKETRQIVILADTSIGMTETVKNRVKLIPQYYYFEENTVYSENNGLTKEEFYRKLETKRAYTAGCNPAETEELFRHELNNGNNIICLSMSSKLSGTYNTLKMIADEVKDDFGDNCMIQVIDTKSTSLGTSFLAEKAVELIDSGEDFDVIVKQLENLVEKIHVYFVVDDLSYLARGGRISSSIAKVGDVLNIKPILYLRDGEIEVHHKARGLHAAVKYINTKLKENDIDKIGIVKLNNENLYNELRDKTGITDSIDLGHVVASHIGPNAISAVFMNK